MSRIMQSLWGFWDALLRAGYKRVPTKITCEECNKASQKSSTENKESQSRICFFPSPTKINNDHCEIVLQNPQNLIKITCEECNRVSQKFSTENKESQSRTCIVPSPTKINNDHCEIILQSPQNLIKITCEECNKPSKKSSKENKELQSRTYIVPSPTKIYNDRWKNVLQSPQNRTIVPMKITINESKSALRSPQNGTIVPTMITNDESNSALQSPQNRTIVPTKITKDESKSAVQRSQSRRNFDITKIANNKCIQNRGLQNLQGRKRLCLVLDLDHTLVHSKLVCKLTPEKAKICLDNVAHKDDLFRWKSPGSDRLVKVRPFVRKFLEEANGLFEMYIYTMAEGSYALHVANLLDPESVYFGSRILSRENCTMSDQKGLDVVPVDESGILILDDTEKVWSRNLSNLILIEKYDYFTSVSEEGVDESESAGQLSCVLKLLQEVHKLYFGQHHMLDVRVLLGMLRQRLRTENCS